MLNMEETKLQKRKRKAQNEGNNRLLVSTCADLSDVYMKSGRFQQAIEEFKTLAEVYKLEHNQIEYGKANRAIGEAYLGLHNFKKALEHQKIYLNIAVSEKNNAEIQRAYATIGHIYLTMYLETQADADQNLNAAYKYFMRSMKVCESLTAINKLEKADMQARLFSNLGLVKDSLGDYNKAIELFTTSINICKANDIYEQLSRGYMSLAALYDKKEETSKTMHHYNLAIEAAKKLKDNIDLMCTALHTKAEALIKLGDFHAAKKTLYKAYKLNSPNIEDRKMIEKYLRAVATMCYDEDKLVVETNDNRALKKLYESMGDCACVVKNYPKAIEYYKLMLNYAERSGVSGKELATCYNSLAQTYEDNKMFKEAVQYFEKEFEFRDNIKDALDAMSKIADNKESAEESMDDVVGVYDKAIKYCQEKDNLKEERRMIARCIKYLQRIGKTSEVCRYQQKLNALKVPDREDDSSSSECESHNSSIIDDKENCLNLDDITDSDDSTEEEKPINPSVVVVGKRRSKNFAIKKNAKGESQLHVACINGKIPVVKHLLEQGHPVNVRDNTGWLPIHEACNHGFYEIVKLLLDKGAAINDRGGVKCEGITPIFDAANNGHLNIVQLLLDRGASVTIKSDNGDTPLNVLKVWHQRYPFEGEDYVLYNTVVAKMTEALKKVGENVSENVVVHEPVSGESEEVVVSEKSEDSEIESDRDSDSSSSNIPLRPSSGPNLLNEYQEIMKNLGKKSSTSNTRDIRSNVRNKPALLREKDVSFDDWLEDDLQPGKATKKRKTSLTEAVVTSSTRKRSSDSPRRNTPNKRLSDENRQISDVIATTSSSPSPTRRIFTPSNIQKNSAKRKIQTSLIDSGISKTTNSVKHRPLQTLQRHRSLENIKQSKITTFGSSKSSIEPDSTMSSPNKFSYTQIPVVQDVTPNIPVAHAISTGDLMVFVDVKVEGKVFRVPVLLAQVQTNTIGWLAEQAALKYARKECSKPELELETTTGALLSDEDPLSLLFPLGTTQAEPVVGKIVKLFETPLVGKYRDACSHMKEAVDDKLVRILEEFSVNLNLQNLGLMSNTLSPLCKALNHQTTLLDLNLSGNFLDIHCMVVLCSSLPSLVNLTSLNLKCTGLSSSHLTELVNMFSIASTRILEKLKRLDLSNNYLRNRSCEQLVEILRHLKLEHLNIANVTFSSGIFQDLHNRNMRLNLQNVKYLNISNNQLSSRDLENIISWTVANNLVDLNLSRNTLKNTTLGHYNEDFDKDDKFNSLHSLNLSRCKLTDNDLYHILRLCSNKSIVKLDVSYNIDLTAVTLRRILELPVLEEINLIGCDNILKYFSEFYEEVTESCRRKCLKLTVDFNMYSSEVDSLIENFKKLYTEPVIDKGERLLIIHSKEWEK
ncbi:tonsoku-like protein [Diabrotica virgifera virgifera]|uniref:Tonsoku-like protein n=1 Tax=Diabrotica virgifera virgifera TaxID=50390 RepID=A0ABM5K9V2_DIAVI|nr:tonsoku-like protein [Diabrotica virgifera virgifera]